MSPRVSIRLLPSQTDGRLVELAGRGDEHAFETLVHRYRRPLQRYCRRLGLSDARAEDVLQYSLTKAWLALSQGKEVRELRPWLYRIVHNDAMNSVLRAPAEHDQLTDTVASSSSSERDLEGRLEAREALARVASLPQMQRHAIVLTAIEGRSHHEAARALGISDGAVRGLLHRARTTLRSAAAALLPPGLLRWPARWMGGARLGERATELSIGGGAVGASGVLFKGAAVTATVGLLALGAGVERSVHRDRAGHARPRQALSARVAARSTAAGAGVAVLGVTTTRDVAATKTTGRVLGHSDGGRHHGRRGRGRGTPGFSGAGGQGPSSAGGSQGDQQPNDRAGSGHDRGGGGRHGGSPDGREPSSGGRDGSSNSGSLDQSSGGESADRGVVAEDVSSSGRNDGPDRSGGSQEDASSGGGGDAAPSGVGPESQDSGSGESEAQGSGTGKDD